MLSRRAAFIILSILSSSCLAFGPPRLVDSDYAQRGLTRQQLRAMRPVPLPTVSAASVLMVNMSNGQVVFARNERERRAPASLTKLVTAMVALQRGKLDREMYVRADDLAVYSAARIQEGEGLNLRELLYMLLIPSDNAASLVIARSLGRDVGTFVGWMNALVASWGLQDTRFTNPHGLDSRDLAYSTAYDMAIIAYHAMNDPLIAHAVQQSEFIIAGRKLESTNKLLNTYSGTIGVKTGTTDRAGECLIAIVDRPSGKVMLVLMGSKDRYLDARLLLDYYYANYAELRIDLQPSPQNRYLDESNAWREFGLRERMILLVKPWEVTTAAFYRRIDDISASPSRDKPIGALEVKLAGRPLTELPLYAR